MKISALLFSLFGILQGLVCAADNTHDPVGRLTRVEAADGTTIDYLLDANGNTLNRTVTRPVNLTLLIDPPGAGTVTGAGRYPKASDAALTATPGSAFDFVAWKRTDGTILSTNSTYPHPATISETLTAQFAPVGPPVITVHPASLTVTSGSAFTLIASVTGHPPLSYRWKKSGQSFDGDDASLTRFSTTVADAGLYTLDVSNGGGKATSLPALVTVILPTYDYWKAVVFSPAELAVNNPDVVGPRGFSSSDGISNLMHYALGSTIRGGLPVESFALQRVPSGASAGCTFEFNRLLGGGGLRYSVAISRDLEVWDTTEGNLEFIAAPESNTDGLTERVKVRLKEPFGSSQSRTFFRLDVAESMIELSTEGSFNYFDDEGFGVPEIRSETPVVGRFEAVAGGLLVKANRPRGGGTLITKNALALQGKTVEFVWAGDGGSQFMQTVCGTITGLWPTMPESINTYLEICTFGNRWNGSWLAYPGVIYRTRVDFTDTAATLITTDFSTGQEYGRKNLSGADFSQPCRLYIRTGDTQDSSGGFILLKNLVISSTAGQ